MQTPGASISHTIVDESRCTGCLNCQLICSITFEDEFNPASARLFIDRMKGKTLSIRFRDDCTKCGLCARHCLYGALRLREES